MALIFVVFAVVAMACILATPLTFFAMLFLGNVGINLGFLDLLPGAVALRIATSSFTTKEK